MVSSYMSLHFYHHLFATIFESRPRIPTLTKPATKYIIIFPPLTPYFRLIFHCLSSFNDFLSKSFETENEHEIVAKQNPIIMLQIGFIFDRNINNYNIPKSLFCSSSNFSSESIPASFIIFSFSTFCLKSSIEFACIASFASIDGASGFTATFKRLPF